jgi:hypothetical protein
LIETGINGMEDGVKEYASIRRRFYTERPEPHRRFDNFLDESMD